MSIDDSEYLVAYDKTIAAHPKAKIFKNKAFDVLQKLNEKLGSNYNRPLEERDTFGALIRETLNHFHLPKGPERTAYAALIGFYFGNKQSKNKVLAAHRVSKKTPPPVKIKLDGNQTYWDF